MDWQSYSSLCYTPFSGYSMICHYGFYSKHMVCHYVIHPASYNTLESQKFKKVVIKSEAVTYAGKCSTSSGVAIGIPYCGGGGG